MASDELHGELLDDFYAEFDELLTSVRNSLVQLEKIADVPEPDAATIEGLFRQLHTLKGISAIAGLRFGEQVAHAMEDLLRLLKKGQVELSPQMVDVLLVAAQRLGLIGAAHRLKKSLPEIDDVLGQLHQFLPGQKPSSASTQATEPVDKPAGDPLAAARERGLHLYTVRFAPSNKLDKRGVNVGSVRERLKAIGEIISATPSVKGKGIVFEFVVGARENPTDFSAWEHDEIKFEALVDNAKSTNAPETNTEVSFSDTLSLSPSHIVRVDLGRLDDLMRITGEMVIQRSRLEERINKSTADIASLKEINLAFSRSLREMRQVITRMRMVPVAEIFSRLPFVVRDLSRESDKKVRVALEGRQTEIDKYVVERLKEPLLHLVRNAFVHGIESPQERTAAGKPAEATIDLRAQSQGEIVVIQIRDDGRGIDPEKVAAKARKLGLPVPERLDSAALLKILCAAGFSIRDEADFAAGRGVGMSVVENTVRELNGSLSLESTLGAGTTFTLKLPLTLSITEALIVTASDQTCAVPQGSVSEIIQLPALELRKVKKTAVIPYRNGLLPVKTLRSMFRFPQSTSETLTVVVLQVERGLVGLVVDRVVAQREIVIRPLADPLLKVPGISGATELGDGRPILILDALEITRGVIRPPHESDSLRDQSSPITRAQ